MTDSAEIFASTVRALLQEIDEVKALVRQYLGKIDAADETWEKDQDALAEWAGYSWKDDP